MSVFFRLSDIVNSNINALVASAENLAKLSRLIIQEMEDTLVEVRSSTVRTIAEQRELERRIEGLRREQAGWTAKAKLALTGDREDLVRGGLAAAAHREQSRKALEQQHAVAAEGLEQQGQEIAKLQAKLADAKAREKSLAQRRDTAVNRIKLHERIHVLPGPPCRPTAARRAKARLFAEGGALAAALWFAPAAAGAQGLGSTKPPTVTVVRAERGMIVETATATGTLVPREEILASPQVGDVAVTQILVEEGDTVAAGQVLARLSSHALNASMAQNAAQIARDQAAIAEAEAARAQAESAFGRTRDLIKTGAASRETYDTRLAAQRTAAARVASAHADLAFALAQRQELAVKLADTEIKAPVGGVVSRRVARIGSVVSLNGDPLFRIISDGAIELEASVPEATLAKLRVGQRATMEMAGGVTRTGTIRLVSPEMSALSRLGRVRVAVNAGAGSLVLGGFGRAVVATASHEGVLVPMSAVLFHAPSRAAAPGAGPGIPGAAAAPAAEVQVVRDGVVDTRAVTLGLRSAGRAEIVEGIQLGEQVVSLSGTFVRDGDHVTAVEPAGRASLGGW